MARRVVRDEARHPLVVDGKRRRLGQPGLQPEGVCPCRHRDGRDYAHLRRTGERAQRASLSLSRMDADVRLYPDAGEGTGHAGRHEQRDRLALRRTGSVHAGCGLSARRLRIQGARRQACADARRGGRCQAEALRRAGTPDGIHGRRKVPRPDCQCPSGNPHLGRTGGRMEADSRLLREDPAEGEAGGSRRGGLRARPLLGACRGRLPGTV